MNKTSKQDTRATTRTKRNFTASDVELEQMKLNARKAGYMSLSAFIRDKTLM